MASPQVLLKGQTLALEILFLEYPGLGIAEFEGRRVEVMGVLPGDRVNVLIVKQYKTHLQGKVQSVITPSPDRQKALCSHFLECGGCQILDVAYPTQLRLKHDVISRFIAAHSQTALAALSPILPSSSSVFYRNKMDFAFGEGPDGLILGLKRRGTFDQIVALSDCVLQDPMTCEILKFTTAFFLNTGLKAWNGTTHEGVLRYLVLRQSKTTGSFLAILVVSSLDEMALFSQFSAELSATFPMIQSICVGLQNSLGDTSFTTQLTVMVGDDPPFLTENLLDLKFQLSPTAFFQTNSAQANVLYQTILTEGQFDPGDRVLDLYCGTGTIGLCIAPHVASVVGVEENPASILDAERNAVLNDIKNIEFHTQNVKNFLKFDLRPVDVIVVDPPRDGLIPKALRRIIERRVKKIIYVSCNMKTLWRDLPFFEQAGYKIEVIQPVDMFPNTWHLETVVRLVLE